MSVLKRQREKKGTKEAWKIARKHKKIWKNCLKTKEKTKDYIYVKIECFFPYIPQHEKKEDGIKLRKSNRIRSHDYSSSPNGSMLYRIDLGEYF